jgi:release factor glutamine methyltransferase
MGIKIQTIKDIRQYLSDELNDSFSGPEIGAITNIIIKTLFSFTKLHTMAFPESPVSQKKVHEIIRICRELKTGKPIQYILGETNFYNSIIKVNNETLIPRPETEELVDFVIKENKGFAGTILDVGTGSGCIAIALAINLPGTAVTGIDISEGAVETARQNASLNKTDVTFKKADILNIGSFSPGAIDIIVANPPYVRDSEKKHMSINVLDFEPHAALFVPDSDPLVHYRAILNFSRTVLNSGGKVYFEINEAMGNLMSELLQAYGYSEVEIIKDINGKDRIIKGIKNGRKRSL